MELLAKSPTYSNGLQALDTFGDRVERLVDQIAEVVVTSRHNIRLVLLGLFAQGHILLEDLPGVGKTLMAKTIAASIDGEFSRIQFTPDLLPGDITGTSVFDAGKQTFEFLPGPIFANVVIADELNRTGPRTQSALLEAMAEGLISADGNVWPLPSPFIIIATQNLIEAHGTFPLPNSQLDRFMVSMTLGLPSEEQELGILRRSEIGFPQVNPVISTAEVVEMQGTVAKVELAPPGPRVHCEASCGIASGFGHHCRSKSQSIRSAYARLPGLGRFCGPLLRGAGRRSRAGASRVGSPDRDRPPTGHHRRAKEHLPLARISSSTPVRESFPKTVTLSPPTVNSG